MGATSCFNFCIKSEDELKNVYNIEEKKYGRKNNNEENNILNYTNNNIDNIIEAEPKIDNKFQEFKNRFETNLPNFGNYIKKEQFNEIIPENVRLYMTNNEFKLPNNIKINENIYEMPPIQFKNKENIYQGYWNENIIMDGLGKYHIKEGNLFIEGVWDNGKAIYGRIYYPNNNIYEGYINNSNCDGKGKILYNTGEIYEGDFINGEIDGDGKFTFKDKTIYEGQFSKGELNGKGIMKWPNGIVYIGYFFGGAFKGEGILEGNGGEKYEGNFLNNYFSGKGKYTFDDGSTYEGDFESGLRNGKGIYNKKDSFSYEGSWANDYAHGFGTFSFGSVNVKGIWRNAYNAEITLVEGCNINEFNHKILNFKIPEINLKTEKLSNLMNANNIKNFSSSTNPSYLNSKENE